jgi:hypothetical protein
MGKKTQLAPHSSCKKISVLTDLCLLPRRHCGNKGSGVIEPPNYDGPHISVLVIMTSDSRTYVPHNLKDLLYSEQDPIIGVLQYYNSLFKIPSE